MNHTCHDCKAEEGQLHKIIDCDTEICPFCGNQLISRNCCYEKLGFNYDPSLFYSGLPKKIYENWLPQDLEKKWIKILEKKGRIPYIIYPVICAKCGKLWPDLFHVPDKEWERYISPNMRKTVICKECYNFIKEVIDNPVYMCAC